MKKILLTVMVVVMLHSMVVGVAGAAYDKKSDKKISVNTGLNLSIPFNTGKTSFELQEAVHNKLTRSTGLEVDHFYIWLELDGQTVLGIDPARAMY
jgi:hypothetical protein